LRIAARDAEQAVPIPALASWGVLAEVSSDPVIGAGHRTQS
jgi:hypothetical protein